MKYIPKKLSNAPQSLLQHKKEKSFVPTYGNYYDKAGLRIALLGEQGHLCAYCMQRINNDPFLTKIEHFKPQCSHSHLSLDYDNHLAVCAGGKGSTETHCDTLKGELKCEDQLIAINPTDAQIMSAIKFSGDGTVFTDNPTWDKEINEKLGLNIKKLKDWRLAVIESLELLVQMIFKGTTLTKQWINKEIQRWKTPDASNQLKSFCQVAIYWLEKRYSKAK